MLKKADPGESSTHAIDEGDAPMALESALGLRGRGPLSRLTRRQPQPPSSAGAAFTSWRSTFLTISVSLAWVGAGTPM